MNTMRIMAPKYRVRSLPGFTQGIYDQEFFRNYVWNNLRHTTLLSAATRIGLNIIRGTTRRECTSRSRTTGISMTGHRIHQIAQSHIPLRR